MNSPTDMTAEATLAIIDSCLHPRELFRPHERMGWVSDYVDLAMRRVFGDATYPFDYHNFAIRFGDANEAIIRKFRGLRGPKVPAYIAGEGVTNEEAVRLWETYTPPTRREDIVIFSRVNLAKLDGAIGEFYTDFEERRRKNKSLRLTHKDFDNFDQSFREANKPLTEVSACCVDYAIFDNDYLNLVELRTTNDTDLPKARTTVKELLRSLVAAGDYCKKLFIGVVSNSKGTHPNDIKNHYAGEWKGHLGSRLHTELVLVEEVLWKLVGPPGMSWYEYQRKVLELFVEAFQWRAKTATERAVILEDEKAAVRAVKQAAKTAAKATKEAAKVGIPAP